MSLITLEEPVDENIGEQLDKEDGVDSNLNVDPFGDVVRSLCDVHLTNYDTKDVDDAHNIHTKLILGGAHHLSPSFPRRGFHL